MNKNMKKIFIIFALLSVVVFTTTQCSDDEFNKFYTDPSKVSTVQVDRLMAGIFKNSTTFWCPDYGRYYCIDGNWIGTFTQTLGGTYPGAEMYNPAYSVNGYWDDFYRALGNFRLMEELYDEMEESEKAGNECFFLATKIYLYDWLSLVLNIYGDAPFTEAGYLPVNNDITTSFAKYETAESLYELILTELSTINNRLGSSEFKASSAFGQQDFFNNGSVTKWRAYTNDIRLRLATRIATNTNSIQSLGLSTVKTILENPTANPVTETNEENIIIVNLKNSFMNYTSGSGLHENGGWRADANQALIDRMRTDPRLRLLYEKTDTTSYKTGGTKYDPDNGVYLGIDYKDLNGIHTQASARFFRERSGTTGISRVVQYGSWWENKKYDAYLFTAPETWFLKAEAEARGWADVPGETAESCFKKAVQLSVEYYFYYYENWDSNGGSVPDEYKTITVPDDNDTKAFANERWAAVGTDYVNDIDAIITQKWLHFSVMCTRESWSEIRRTGFPSGLYYPKGSGTIPRVPDRWKYPENERTYNSHNYESVASKDTYTTPLFWMKTDWYDNEYSGKALN
jgi:hypothetical protein